MLGIGAVAMIAFPDWMVPEIKQQKKRFTGKHWGAYHDSQTEVDENDVVEVGVPSRKVRHVIGSRTYAGGRGVRQS